MQSYDHVILGTGQALGTLLGHLIPTGDSIAVIEGDRVGGTCVNTGCTPTKALVATARVAHMVRRAADFGIVSPEPSVDFAAVRSRMNAVRDNTGMVRWLEETENVTLVRGWGRFTGPREITVGDTVVRGKQVYINAGARPRTPDVDGLDSVAWLDNGRLLDLTEPPEHLVIVGGSYIGLEMAQVFRRLGSAVSVLERGPQLVPREDEDVAQAIREILELEDIDIRTDVTVRSVGPAEAGVRVSLEGDGVEETLTGSHLLIAAGRVPNSDKLGLDAAGIAVDERGYIAVDDHCRTSVDGVYAVGDINGRGAFTHTSVNDAEIVLDLMRSGSRKLSDRITVYALFIDPALGRVGMTEREARTSGRRVLKATRPMSSISRAKEMGETLGFAKLLVDGDTDEILGASILGPGGDEIVNMLAAHMYTGLTCSVFRRSVLVHPTIGELMPWILDELEPLE